MEDREPEEVSCYIAESDLFRIRSLITQIIAPTVAYSDDPLAMANAVIVANQKKAAEVLRTLPSFGERA